VITAGIVKPDDLASHYVIDACILKLNDSAVEEDDRESLETRSIETDVVSGGLDA